MKKICIRTEYIQLQNVLKLENIISTGGEAKLFLQQNDVLVNDLLENRRGRKLYVGDRVKVNNEVYLIVDDVG